jgi:hypothetical protein
LSIGQVNKRSSFIHGLSAIRINLRSVLTTCLGWHESPTRRSRC